MTIAQISSENILYNLNQFKKYTNTSIIPVLKSNAYGHGIEEVFRIISKEVNKIAVFDLDEALKIKFRNTLILRPIHTIDEITIAYENGFIFNLCSYKQLDIIKKLNIRPRVEIEVDTGMNRTGIWYEEFEDFYNVAKNFVKIEGVYSHFSNADNMNDEFSNIQYQRFISVVKDKNLKKHISNTSASLRYKYYLDAIRIGIGIYGVYPNRFLSKFLDLKPVMTLKSEVIQVKTLKKGESVGYSGTFKAKSNMKIAIISFGYADGFPIECSNITSVYAKGRFRKVLGRISMNMSVIEGEDLKEGDMVEIFGENINLLDISESINKIPYVILSSIGSRVKRVVV
ncbi:MAG: alanine racemase [candidate division WOR-3 bacterium]|nr:alanine racemase [candidate division WOR-3 bacterium]